MCSVSLVSWLMLSLSRAHHSILLVALLFVEEIVEVEVEVSVEG